MVVGVVGAQEKSEMSDAKVDGIADKNKNMPKKTAFMM